MYLLKSLKPGPEDLFDVVLGGVVFMTTGDIEQGALGVLMGYGAFTLLRYAQNNSPCHGGACNIDTHEEKDYKHPPE